MKKAHIPETVTSIGEYAFYGCAALQEINIPEVITVLNRGALRGCASLEGIALPQGLTEIRNEVFMDSGLKGIDIPERVTSLGVSAFRGCRAMTALTVPGNVKAIGNYCFYDCTGLESLTLEMGIQTIGEYAIPFNAALKSIVLPDSVTAIGRNGLSDNDQLESVTLSQGLTSIPVELLRNVPKLTSILIPYRVTSIGARAFQNDLELTDVTIPESVTSIDPTAFSYRETMRIHGVSGSYAETFARANAFIFVPLEDVPVTSITTWPEALVLSGPRQSGLLTLSIEPRNFTGPVIWETSAAGAEIITVDANGSGQITAKKAGTATVKIAVGDQSALVQVTVLQPVTGIRFNAPRQMSVNETVQLTATVSPDTATIKEVEWSSSDPSVLTVDETGLVTAVGKGTANIIATAKDGNGGKGSATIQVPNTLYRVNGINGFESPHNYENNCSDLWMYTSEGATWIDLTFDAQTHFENEFDYLKIMDGSRKVVGNASGYTGDELAGKTVRVSGSTVCVQLISGGSGTDWGFKVTGIQSDGAVAPDFVLPASLKEIRAEAFAGGAMRRVALSDQVTAIGSRAFAQCGSLTDIYIPSAETTIAEDAFDGVNGLTIHGVKGGKAEAFAAAHGFTFAEE